MQRLYSRVDSKLVPRCCAHKETGGCERSLWISQAAQQNSGSQCGCDESHASWDGACKTSVSNDSRARKKIIAAFTTSQMLLLSLNVRIPASIYLAPPIICPWMQG